MKLDITAFLIFSFAIWRISSLFANEDGPFHTFKHLRLYIEKLSENNFFCKAFHLYEGLRCEWCNSIWFAFLLSPVIFERTIFNLFCVPLAASSVAIFMKYSREAIERSNRHVIKRSQNESKGSKVNHN